MDKLCSFFSLGWPPDCSWFLFSFAEQKRLNKTDIPLLHRLLQGPSKMNARIFLMDKDAEEISSDVWMPLPWICLWALLTQYLPHKRSIFLFFLSGGSVYQLSFFSPGIYPSKIKWRREKRDSKNSSKVSQELAHWVLGSLVGLM